MYAGTLISFDSGSYTALVELVGSPARWLRDARVSRAIPPAEMLAGRWVLVWISAGSGLAVVVAVWT